MSNALHIALAVLAVTSAAHAQTADNLTLTLTSSAFPDDTRKVIGGPQCGADLGQTLNLSGTLDGSFQTYTLRLTWTTGTTPCSRELFDGGCDNDTQPDGEETCGCIAEVDETGTITSNTLSFSDLIPDACDQGTGESEVRFYLEYFNTTDSTELNSTAVIVTFDFDPPSTPLVAPSVTPVDGAIDVSVTEASEDDVDYYDICYFKTGAPVCVDTTDTTHRLEGLDNGEAYTIYYQVVDYAGNVSGQSPEVVATPEESQDFAEFYSNIPGKATGCSARPGEGTPAWLWLFLPLLGFGRRRTAMVLAGIGLLMLAQPAFAQKQETARESVFEFRMGSYLPNIDDEFGDACATQNCPYASAFDSGDPLMLTFSYSRLVFTGFGSLAAGGGFGYWNNDEGRAIRSLPSDELDFAADSTEISVYPFFLELGYRLDVLQDIIPLVPAVKLGLDAYGWRIFDGAGEVARFHEFGTKKDAGAAAGISYGWHGSLGVHILLDYFAPDMAADFDRDAGVNNSYLTIDYQVAQISNFGAGETLWLGSEVLFIGLALDM